MSKSWRDLSLEAQDRLVEEVQQEVRARLEEGMRKYQSHIKGFQGQPLDHLGEELFDGVVYFLLLRRQLHYNMEELIAQGNSFIYQGKRYRLTVQEVTTPSPEGDGFSGNPAQR